MKPTSAVLKAAKATGLDPHMLMARPTLRQVAEIFGRIPASDQTSATWHRIKADVESNEQSTSRTIAQAEGVAQ